MVFKECDYLFIADERAVAPRRAVVKRLHQLRAHAAQCGNPVGADHVPCVRDVTKRIKLELSKLAPIRVRGQSQALGGASVEIHQEDEIRLVDLVHELVPSPLCELISDALLDGKMAVDIEGSHRTDVAILRVLDLVEADDIDRLSLVKPERLARLLLASGRRRNAQREDCGDKRDAEHNSSPF